MNIFLVFLILGVIFFVYKKIKSKKPKNLKLDKFKNKHQSTQTNIERIFLREEEKTFSNPNINIYIGSYDNEYNINRKSNIHRARPCSVNIRFSINIIFVIITPNIDIYIRV